MQRIRNQSKVRFIATVALALSLCAGVSVVSMTASATPHSAAATAVHSALSADHATGAMPAARLDRTGKPHVGKASFYADRYDGKTMADGTAMNRYSNNAASTSLPLGTTARVTNLETGRSTWVTIRDRGPYVNGRIIDLSPVTARRIGLDRKQGLATVEVAPMSIPMADGSIKDIPVHLAKMVHGDIMPRKE